MEIPAVTREAFLVRLRDIFYEVVPVTYQTYCVLTAQVCQRVLLHFGFEARLVPCQLWWAGPDGNFVVGFYKTESDAQWDGHAICMTDGWFIDAALHHLRKNLNIEIPNILVHRTFDIPSNVISRFTVNERMQLWWHHPPRDHAVVVPPQPEHLVDQYTNALISRIQVQIAAEASNQPSNAVRCLR